jgi:glutamate N-acetyltransferase / amino-acid N-acetyltransferase
MKAPFRRIPGSVTAPQGFLAAGVFGDIKRLWTDKGSNKGKKRDLALIVSEAPATVAGMFTTSQVCAAPVKVCEGRIGRGVAQAVVANSGNANACTGARGLRDARAMTAILGDALSMPAEKIFVASTGRIGVALPMAHVRRGILAATRLLDTSEISAHQVAEAILTNDTKPKEIAVEFKVRGKTVRIGGVCNGREIPGRRRCRCSCGGEQCLGQDRWCGGIRTGAGSSAPLAIRRRGSSKARSMWPTARPEASDGCSP